MLSVQAAETQSEGSFHPRMTIFTRFPKQKRLNLLEKMCMQNCAENYDNVFWLRKF